MLNKLKDYKKQIKINESLNVKGEYALGYHLMPPAGWLNDPNGLCQFNGIYNIYYQYSPNDVHNGLKGWGLFQTKDFINFKSQSMVVYPDNILDKSGAYSGSAIVKDNQIHYFYTGNVKLDGEYDYINDGREHNTITFTSKDGVNMSEKVCLLKNEDYPNDLTCHVRDPKIEKINDTYYMVLGARTKNDIGCVLLYKSKDLKTFEYVNRYNSDEYYGYMWECPDLIRINNKNFLITCPQGVETKGYLYESIYQNGYFILNDNVESNEKLGTFHEMDLGFDFYAGQSFIDESGRRIFIGWMGLPDVDYTNPTIKDNWQQALTIPRELVEMDGMLYQKPIKELEDLQASEIININDLKSNMYRIKIDFSNNDNFKIILRTNTILNYENGLLSLIMNDAGYGRGIRNLEINNINNIEIFSDISSIEIFINDGYKTMTSRVYDHNTSLKIDCDEYNYQAYYMKRIKVEN